MTDPIRDIKDQALSALALLTRLPLPNHRPMGARSAWAWPLVGALLGGIGALGLWALDGIVPPGPRAAVVLAVLALLTGALHEDGLADTADGLLGGRTPERRLQIMQDSRIGSFGGLALVLLVLAQWSALATASAGALVAACALSRLPMVLIMALLPPARPGGLSAATGRPRPVTCALALFGALLVSLLAVGASASLAALAALTVVALPLALAAKAKIGGQTGDILGASQALAFAAGLSVLA